MKNGKIQILFYCKKNGFSPLISNPFLFIYFRRLKKKILSILMDLIIFNGWNPLKMMEFSCIKSILHRV